MQGQSIRFAGRSRILALLVALLSSCRAQERSLPQAGVSSPPLEAASQPSHPQHLHPLHRPSPLALGGLRPDLRPGSHTHPPGEDHTGELKPRALEPGILHRAAQHPAAAHEVGQPPAGSSPPPEDALSAPGKPAVPGDAFDQRPPQDLPGDLREPPTLPDAPQATHRGLLISYARKALRPICPFPLLFPFAYPFALPRLELRAHLLLPAGLPVATAAQAPLAKGIPPPPAKAASSSRLPTRPAVVLAR